MSDHLHVSQQADVLIASSAADELAASLGFTEQERAEVILVVRELATNIVKHAGEGEVVVVSAGGSSAQTALDQAREYLEDQGAPAEYVQGSRPAAKLILDTAAERDSNLILMGGFGYRLHAG